MNVYKYQRTKIIATIGPASSTEEIISNMVQSGVDVFRLNFSHGSHKDHKKYISTIRRVSRSLKKPVGLLGDLQGPKIRIGKVQKNGIELKEGENLRITIKEMIGEPGIVSTTYENLINDLQAGDQILLDDGHLELKVRQKKAHEIICKIEVGGILTSNKGMNLPGVHLSTPSLTAKDHEDLLFALNSDIDFIALSFVRHEQDLQQVYDIMKDEQKEMPVIAKIEKPQALKRIDQIIKHSYGIMVARGDLGVEIPTEEVPGIQKEIIKKCNRAGKPVIIATQMLDSMIRLPRPTRAEASDVANAVLDGADVVMLSGETAAGKYPVRSVKMMSRVVKSIETQFIKVLKKRKSGYYEIESVGQGIGLSAVEIADKLSAKFIVCITRSGQTARQIARYKSRLPVIAITDDVRVSREMSLIWGITCLYIKKIEKSEACFQEIEHLIMRIGGLVYNDLIVITAGLPYLTKNSTNMLKIHQIKNVKAKGLLF